MLKISILTDESSWLNKFIDYFIKNSSYKIKKIYNVEQIENGDILFILGYLKIVDRQYLKLNKNNLVVHESELPQGKGWSPLTWQILEGKSEIAITLFEATEKVDDGRIYLQSMMKFNGTELVEELREIQGLSTMKLCEQFIDNYPQIIQNGKAQEGESTFYPRRTPKDSEISIYKTLNDQINLLRVVDNELYPAFFYYKNQKYRLKIEKCDE